MKMEDIMKKHLFIVVCILLSSLLFSIDSRKSNFRVGGSYFNYINSAIPLIDNVKCKSEKQPGMHCEVLIPLKNFNNLDLLVGGVWVISYSEAIRHTMDTSYDYTRNSEISGGYLGVHSSFGKVVGFEGSASIGYFGHYGSISKQFGDSSEPYVYTYAAGSSVGGYFSAGPYVNIGPISCAVNAFLVSAGSETGIYTRSFGIKMMLGTSLNF
jgi:hypothetical protein